LIPSGPTFIVEPDTKNAFAIWVTGLPASGKSTLVALLKAQLEGRGIDVEVLESDVLRKILEEGNFDLRGPIVVRPYGRRFVLP